MRNEDGSFTAFDGETIRYRAWLPDADPTAVVIIVHGLGEHIGRYDHVASALVEHGHAVWGYDQRGHGLSSGTRVFVDDYDDLLRDLHQFRGLVVGRHRDVPLVLLGHSMGGNVAMGYTLGNADGLAALVLSGPALKVADDLTPAKQRIFSLLAKIAPGSRPQGIPAEAISRDPSVVEAYRDDPLVHHGKVTAGLGAALIAAMRRFPDRYHELDLPILVLHGTDDVLADVEGSRHLEASATSADVTAIYYEGLHHEVFNEPEQDRVLTDLVSWLDDTLGPT